MKYNLSIKLSTLFGTLALVAFNQLAEAQTNFDWKLAGPLYTAGRIRNLVVDKTDNTGKTMYCGSTSSGVFTSTNGGVRWFPINDQAKVRNISYMGQDKSNNIWAATGEGFLRYGQKAKAQRGTGIYKLDLSTKELKLVKDSNAVGAVINRIAFSPANANYIALASNLGIMVSNDGGGSFNLAPGIPTNSNVIFGMDVKFDNAGVLYCSVGNERGGAAANAAFDAVSSKVYKSTDATLSAFTNITPISSVLTDSKYGRIELGISESNSSVIYASCANKNISQPTGAAAANSASLKGIFVSYDAGATWGLLAQGSPQLDPLSNSGSLSTGDYAHCLLVHPSNPDILFIGGYKFCMFTRTGGTNANPIGNWVTNMAQNFFTSSPSYLHENIHDIKIIPGSPVKFYLVTDAGIYRSIDLAAATSVIPPSFQPFYSGLVTGQFNSVSIERFPVNANGSNVTNGTNITPLSGFIGGTGANGFSYYSGRDTLVTQETSYLNGDIYNAEYSKILEGAAFLTVGTGGFYRTANVKNTSPNLVDFNVYTGDNISALAPDARTFLNTGFSTGTPFKLWENYGQIANSPDKAIFYNDSLRLQYSISGVSTLTTITNFTFSASRPNRFATIDSIAIRTGTVVLPTTQNAKSPPFSGTDKQDIWIKIPNTSLPSTTINVSTSTVPVIYTITPFNGSNITTWGPAVNAPAATGVTLNATTMQDVISVTFNAPPFAAKTTASLAGVPDAASYYRVFATVFYKYKVGDTVSVTDNNISTKTYKYSTALTTPLRWSRKFVNVNQNTNGPKTGQNPAVILNKSTNPLVKIPTTQSGRLAMVLNHPAITANTYPGGPNPYAIVVCKSPLNLNDPLNFVRVSQSGCLSDSSNGQSPVVNVPISITGKPIILEWSKGGTEIYYATDDYKLYRVSHINDIFDLSPSSYSGKFYSDVFSYANPLNSANLNPDCPYRTTLIGSFDKPITSISVSNDDKNLLITFNNPAGTGTTGIVMYNSNDARTSNLANINWQKKDGAVLAGNITYCSLMEKSDNKQVFVGTDNGMFYTSDITSSSPSWSNINNNQLPNVQIFDIKQQTFEAHNCYNSGQIYVATNGRGVWTSGKYLSNYYVGISESTKPEVEKNLNLYPNPSNGLVNVVFNAFGGENASIHVMDLNGRTVKTHYMGELPNQEIEYSMDASGLAPGIYLVSVTSNSGVKRVAKLVVTK